MRATLFLFLWLACGAARAEPDPDLTERLAACATCHGEAGEGQAGNEYYPHLAGKPAGYLASQLRAFRDGRRAYAQMNWLMRNLDDDYLRRIASHYAALPPRSSAQAVAMSPSAQARARHLVERGDEALGVPACEACHGGDLAGREPGVPALLGLPPDYVVAQLGAWRTGVRAAESPDCMADIARKLLPSDLRLLGDYLASQGATSVAPPSPATAFALPVACGAMAGGTP